VSCSQIITQDLWPAGGLIPVGECPVLPAPHLVSKYPGTGHPSGKDWGFYQNASRLGVAIGAGPHRLHDVLAFGYVNLKGGVIQVERLSPLQASLDRLIDPSVQPNEPCATSPKRDPIQVDADPGPIALVRCLATNHRLFLLAVARFLMHYERLSVPMAWNVRVVSPQWPCPLRTARSHKSTAQGRTARPQRPSGHAGGVCILSHVRFDLDLARARGRRRIGSGHLAARRAMGCGFLTIDATHRPRSTPGS